jgi:hypothetical protein
MNGYGDDTTDYYDYEDLADRDDIDIDGDHDGV